MATFIIPKQVIVWVTSTEVFSSWTEKGKQFFEMTNDWTATIYLAFGKPAELGKWTPLASGARYYLDATNNIDKYFIRAWCNWISTESTSVAIQEFDYDNN